MLTEQTTLSLLDGRAGKATVLLAMEHRPEQEAIMLEEIERHGFRAVKGRVGSMDAQKIVAAVETACRRTGLVSDTSYREEHALYHAILEALHGIGRGQLAFGTILRTVGLSFAVLRGRREAADCESEGEWLVVALYGTIGAPIKGWEHEVVGMGVNHI